MGFLSPAYFNATGSVHSGCDYNGIFGGNTDLGAPIYAIGDGVVVHCRAHRVWGWVIVIRHENVPVYGTLESQYAHPEKPGDVLVKVGQRVTCGQQIARIGRGTKKADGNWRFYAHLHFEIRKAIGLPGDEWPSTTMQRAAAEAYCRRTRLDPQVFLQEVNAATKLEDIKPAKTASVADRFVLVDGGGKQVPWDGKANPYGGVTLGAELLSQLDLAYPVAGGPWQHGALKVWRRQNGVYVLEKPRK